MTIRIAVIGTGYVGLVTGACFAHVGYTVTCLDIDPEKIAQLQRKEIPIHEPELNEIVVECTDKENLQFTTDYASALKNTHIIIIAVDTPSKADGTCDISNILKAAETIGTILSNDAIIIIKSTVPVGTTERVETLLKQILLSCNLPYSIDVVSNPEFLREGAAVYDFLHPERIIIGSSSERAIDILKKLYVPFLHGKNRIIIMDSRSSELTKYAANTMLACRISFMNSLSQLCDVTGANIESIREGIGSDFRIGPEFLRAGVGYGGSCFPKDVAALRGMFTDHGVPASLIQAIDGVNEIQKEVLYKKILNYFTFLEGKKIAILGLAFKPNTDDMRKAPSITTITALNTAGAILSLYDPIALQKAKKIFKNLDRCTFCTSIETAITNADGLVIMTEHDACKKLSFTTCKNIMKSPVIFDGRNLFSLEEAEKSGITYISIGRPPVLNKNPLSP